MPVCIFGFYLTLEYLALSFPRAKCLAEQLFISQMGQVTPENMSQKDSLDFLENKCLLDQMWWHMINKDTASYQRWVFRITQPPKFPNFRFSVSDIQSNSYRASVFDGSWISGALAFPTIIGLSVTVLKWKMMWRCYWYNLTLCSLFLFQSQYIEISSRYIWRKMWAKFVTFYESILSKSFWLKTCQGKLNIN